MKSLKGILALILLTGLVLVLAANLFAHRASAHAEFETWANRSMRVSEPVGYNTSGTPVCQACQYTRGMNTIGNVGIGNGNYTLMKPAVMNGMIESAEKAMSNSTAPAASNDSANSSASIKGSQSVVPPGSKISNETEVQESCPACSAAAEAAEAPVVDLAVPDFIMAGSVIMEGRAETITLGRPFPHILNEDPVEPTMIYGKLLGLPMPDGTRMDFGIKSPGYEY